MTDLPIAVVGSISLDVVVPVPQLPMPGQAVLGGGQSRHHGGKGANQAVAASRLGGSVAMVGRVGADESGPALVDALGAEGIDIAHVSLTEGVPTGRALIAMDPAGENTIIITPGGNGRLTPRDCDAAKDVLAAARVTLLQQEIPHESNEAAARLSGGLVLLNPAPVRIGETALPEHVDVLLPGRSELAGLLGVAPDTLADADDIARAAHGVRGARAVLVMLGAEGALLIEGRASTLIRPFPVRAVDMMAATDCLCGALACALADGEPLERAAVFGVAAAAISSTRAGSRPSMPARDEVERFLAAHR